MKKSKPARRAGKTLKGRNQNTASKKAAPKRVTNTTAPKTVDAYLAAVPEPARSALEKIRAAIRSVVPPETTEIISYKIPAFKHQKVLVWYAAFANHCSLFPTAAVIEAHRDELKGFSTSKGTIHFPLNKPMPVDLIKKLVKDRLGRSG